MSDEVRVSITSDADMVPARAEGRALAMRLGFSRTDATLVATAISEIARNIVAHVGEGELLMRPVFNGDRRGLVVIARDEGPGIPDLGLALGHGYTSRGGLGLGMSGARRLMDDFAVESAPGRGTVVTMTKWRTQSRLEMLRARQSR